MTYKVLPCGGTYVPFEDWARMMYMLRPEPVRGKFFVEDFHAGLLVHEALHDLTETPGPDNASIFHDWIEAYLKSRGFYVDREYECEKRNGRKGRIDLMVMHAGGQVGIELDWKLPRYRSLDKLRRFTGYRISVLRLGKPWNGDIPYGLEAVVCIPVVDTLTALKNPEIAARMLASS